MANIQSVFIIKAEDGSLVNGISSYDLSTIVGGNEVPKEVTGVYIVQNGSTFTEYNYAAPGSKYVTKVTNQATGEYAYLDEPTGSVSDLLTNPSCTACADSGGGTPVNIVTSCADPLYVKVCEYTANDRELIFTDAEPICVTLNGVSSTYLVRERIVWDSITYQEITRQTEYSADGLTWTTTAPTGTIVIGSCEKPVAEDCELIITSPVPYCVRFGSPSTDPNCCDIEAVIYQQWFIRERIVWNSVDCVEESKTIEYSSDGITWTQTAPVNGKLGECPTEAPQKCGCCPSISEAFGDDLSTLLASHNFVFEKPDCCKLKVDTTIGSFHILKGVSTYSTSDFECLFEITGLTVVEGSCTLDQVHIIGNKLK